MHSINPATGRVIAEYPPLTTEQAQDRVRACARAQAEWAQTPLDRRASRLRAVAEALESGQEGLAALITREMGKPLAESRAEIVKCAQVCRFYADNAPAMLAEEPVATEAARSLVRLEPLGLVLAVMPWNYPFWQVVRLAAPALMAGNGYLLKPAENVPGCGLALERVFASAGLPEGLFTTLLVPVAQVEAVAALPQVRLVALTGSVRAGRAVAAMAGRCLKKSLMELGGCDPLIVLEDADLTACCAAALRSRMQNAGQTCIAAKRMLVAAPLVREFEERLAALAWELRVGDPLLETTDMGPLARADIREALARQIGESLGAGARLVLGGCSLDGPGFFHQPTILADVRPGMAAFEEETFGPLAAITPVAGEEEAVALANASDFGLGASVWTADLARGEALARRIQAGTVMVNALTRSDFRLPFGGVKNSGWGRELSSYGIRELVNVKAVWVG